MKKYQSRILIVLLVLLSAKVLLPQLDSLRESIQALQSADLSWILLGILVFFSGVPILAVQFTALAFRKLVFLLTLRVQAATLFVNKILPNGVGTISLNAYYLVKKGHTPSQATSVLTVNTLTSLTAYITIIIAALLVSPLNLSLIASAKIPIDTVLFLVLLLIGAGFILYRVRRIREKIRQVLHNLRRDISTYKARPKSVLVALIFNGMGTSVNVLTIMFAAHAVGIEVSFANALLAYTFGNIASAIVPTPGGIGSIEAGIYSGLVLVGLDPTDSMTVTLLYRLISYWLPILPGYFFFWSLKKDLLADYSPGGRKSKKARESTSK